MLLLIREGVYTLSLDVCLCPVSEFDKMLSNTLSHTFCVSLTRNFVPIFTASVVTRTLSFHPHCSSLIPDQGIKIFLQECSLLSLQDQVHFRTETFIIGFHRNRGDHETEERSKVTFSLKKRVS